MTDPSQLFLTCGLPAQPYLQAMATAAQHVADVCQAVTRPTSGAAFADLPSGLSDLPVCPDEPVGLDRVMAEVRDHVLSDVTAVSHPYYVAHLHCPAVLPALAAEVMISATNQSMDSFDQGPSATLVECRVVDWMLDMVGFAPGGDGVFTSGATQSNLMGLLLARDFYARTTLGWSVGRLGLPPAAQGWRVLCSPLAHFSVAQSCALLGLGDEAILDVGCDVAGRMGPRLLRDRIEDSLRRGEQPVAVVLTAGTTDLGSIDPLPEATAVAREYGLWIHVDAAAGGSLLLSERHRALLRGVEMADSVAIDFHKLLFQPISCGLFLVRDAASFELMRRHAEYLNPVSDELDGTPNLVRKSLQTTRRFDSLKVFMTMRALGRRMVAQLIDATVDAAQAAAREATAHPDIRLVAPVATSTVALRWAAPDVPDRHIRPINDEIRCSLSREGRALIGRTEHGGLTALKLTFVNPLCTPDHARQLVAEIAVRGRRLAERIDMT